MFSAHKIFTTFCVPFPNRISGFKVLAMPGLCALFIAYTNPRGPCVSRSLEAGNTFLILSYSKAKGKNVFRVVRVQTKTMLSLDFPLNFLKSSLVTHYAACSFLPA